MTVSKIEMILLACLLLVGGFFRLYHIKDTAMFLGDQGRDAIIAKDIIKHGDIALIGPVTSVGNMYLGPFYYYFMVPWLAISSLDPIGPAVGVALVGIATIPLLYFMTRKMFGASSALVATSLFTTSYIAIDQVRFSWNPNLAPTVGLIIFYLTYRLMVEKNYRLIVWLGVWFAIIIQLHYMALLLAVFIGIPVAHLFITQKKHQKDILKNAFIALVLVAVSTIPLILFDVRHEHLISRSFADFFSSNQEHIVPTSKFEKIASNFSGNLFKLIPQMLGSVTQTTHKIITLIFLVVSLAVIRKSNANQKQALTMSLLWLAVASLLMSFYSSSIFIHYLSFSQAVSFVIVGGLLGLVFDKSPKLIQGAIVIAVLAFMVVSPRKSGAFAVGQMHIDRAKIVSQSIVDRVADDELYNIVLISGTGDIDAQSYRYFLEISGKPPVKKEQRGEVKTLFIIQEDYFDTNVVDSPIYEIVVFPDKTPAEVYTIENGPTITVLKKN